MKSTMSLFLAAVLFTGCASAPEWVKIEGAAFEDNMTGSLYGLGIASKGPNVAATRKKAETRARAKLAEQVESYVTTFSKDFMEENKDFYEDPGAASSSEYFSTVAKQTAEATLNGTHVIDTYEDDENWYVMMKLPLDGSFAQQMKQRMLAVARERQNALLRVKTDDAIQELDKALDQKLQRQNLGY